MSAPRFDALVAVGDNLSLDTGTVGPQKGAASLLYRNRDADWPDFRGRDLVTRDPAVRLLVLGQDGATTRSTLNQQMKRVPVVEEPVLAIITAGSRDLMALLGLAAANNNGTVADADELYDVLTGIIEELGRRLADVYLMVGNIPSPAEEEPPLVAELNTAIADVTREQGASLADIHAHFKGHGPSAGEEAWLTPNLDPTPRGASEIRRLFWQALMDL